jgi:FkbM family methyltransferase
MISKYIGIDLSKYRLLRQLKFKIGIFFGIYQDGLKDLRKVIKQYVKKDFICVDVGASIGDVTKMLSKKAKTVYSFEPQFSSYVDLCQRFKNNDKITLHYSALSDHNDTEIFYRRKHGCHSSLLPEGLSEVIEQSRVFVRELDGFKLKPDFIKIDTEGSELDVLRGGRETIKKYHPIIFVECWKDRAKEKAIRKFLYECGYTDIQRFDNDILAIK